MMLLEQGKIMLEEPVAKYIPAFKDVKVGVESKGEDGKPKLELVDAKKPITIQDLLRHSSGLTYGIFGNSLVKKAYLDAKIIEGDFDNAEFAERIAKLAARVSARNHMGLWLFDRYPRPARRSRVRQVALSIPEGEHPRSARHERHELLCDGQGKASAHRRAFQGRPARSAPTPSSTIRALRRNGSPAAAAWSARSPITRAFARCWRTAARSTASAYLGPKTIAYMTSDHMGSVITPGPYYLPGPGYGFGLGFAVRKEAGVATYTGLRRRLQLGRRRRHVFLGRSEGEHVRGVRHAIAAQPRAFRQVLRNIVYSGDRKSGACGRIELAFYCGGGGSASRLTDAGAAPRLSTCRAATTAASAIAAWPSAVGWTAPP